MNDYPKIANLKGVYVPREDSFLLADAVEKYAFGKVLDIGTGTGILGIIAARKGCEVTFADIDDGAIRCAKANAKANLVGGDFVISDMFSNIDGLFNTIIFNPPYLDSEALEKLKCRDLALDGGEGGRELIDLFLSQYKNHLLKKNIVLLLESSLNGYENDVRALNAELVGTAELFFETIAVLMLK